MGATGSGVVHSREPPAMITSLERSTGTFFPSLTGNRSFKFLGSVRLQFMHESEVEDADERSEGPPPRAKGKELVTA